MLINRFRGWMIWYDKNVPITGRYRAKKFGVTINAGDFDSLWRMIRHKEDV